MPQESNPSQIEPGRLKRLVISDQIWTWFFSGNRRNFAVVENALPEDAVCVHAEKTLNSTTLYFHSKHFEAVAEAKHIPEMSLMFKEFPIQAHPSTN